MNRGVVVVLSLFVLLALIPLGSSQGLPTTVDGCKTKCKPKNADVNGETVKTGDEQVQVILYGHFEDILNRAPLNTQIPCGEGECNNPEPNLNRGFLTPTLAVPDQAGQTIAHFENNWFYMFSSAGFVEIVDGAWRTHQEPGLAEEVKIVGDTIHLYFYLSAYPVPGQDSDAAPTGKNVVDAMPQVGVYARIETGRFPNAGTLIAEGDTGAGDAVPGVVPNAPGRVTLISAPGQPDIYEIDVPMKVVKNVIPDVRSGAAGFLVSINPYQIKQGDGGRDKDTQISQNDWRVRVGPKTPPHIVLTAEKSMMTKAASLSVYNGAMYVRWSFVSPWGSYDVNDRTINVQLMGGPTSPDPSKVGLSRPLVVKRSVDHDAHFKPVNATWKFDYQKANLADGEYMFHLNVMNLQETYQLQETLKFTMAGGQPQDMQIIGAPPPSLGPQAAKKGDSPGLAGVAAVAALAVAALAIDRRRRL